MKGSLHTLSSLADLARPALKEAPVQSLQRRSPRPGPNRAGNFQSRLALESTPTGDGRRSSSSLHSPLVRTNHDLDDLWTRHVHGNGDGRRRVSNPSSRNLPRLRLRLDPLWWRQSHRVSREPVRDIPRDAFETWAFADRSDLVVAPSLPPPPRPVARANPFFAS